MSTDPSSSSRARPQQEVLSFVGQLDAEVLDGRYLGPATVREAGAGLLVARLPTGEEVTPAMALAYPFVPAEGDNLLLIGQGDRYFVIGVLESRGQTKLRFQGDVEVRAVDGELDLHGGRGVEVRGPKVDVRTRNLDVLAEQATEIVGSAFSRVKELLSVHVGEADVVARGTWSRRSKRASITSEEVVSVNGKEVHLG